MQFLGTAEQQYPLIGKYALPFASVPFNVLFHFFFLESSIWLVLSIVTIFKDFSFNIFFYYSAFKFHTINHKSIQHFSLFDCHVNSNHNLYTLKQLTFSVETTTTLFQTEWDPKFNPSTFRVFFRWLTILRTFLLIFFYYPIFEIRPISPKSRRHSR